jgi:NADPH2:quinone reductase
MMMVNPLTVIALLGEFKRYGARAAVQTAAASQVGRMMIHMANEENYPLINLVRREEQEKLLKE